jgi:hypothetical protein
MSSRQRDPKSKSPENASPTATPPPDGAQQLPPSAVDQQPTSPAVSGNPEPVPSPAAVEPPQDPAGPINTQIPFVRPHSTLGPYDTQCTCRFGGMVEHGC